MAQTMRETDSKTKYSHYVEGTAVRELVNRPARKAPEPTLAPEVSRVAKVNRQRAMQMNLGYVIFLTVISVVTLFLCVNFVQLKAQLTSQMENVAKKETELSVLKADNDAFYNSVASSVDLEYIKSVATNELDMKYPSEEQIVYFDTSGNGYVRQYQDVPEVK